MVTSSDYNLGRQLAGHLKRQKGQSQQQINGLLQDLMGVDQSMLAPLRDLMSSPAFRQEMHGRKPANPYILRVSLLSALSETYQPQVINRLKDFIDGYLSAFSANPEPSRSSESKLHQKRVSPLKSSFPAVVNKASNELDTTVIEPSASRSTSHSFGDTSYAQRGDAGKRWPLGLILIALSSILGSALLVGLIVLMNMAATILQQKNAESPTITPPLKRENQQLTDAKPKISPNNNNPKTAHELSLDDLADEIFWRRHPSLNGQKLNPNNRNLAIEWARIRECDAVVDQKFYRIYPEMRGKIIDPSNQELVEVWKQIEGNVASCH